MPTPPAVAADTPLPPAAEPAAPASTPTPGAATDCDEDGDGDGDGDGDADADCSPGTGGDVDRLAAEGADGVTVGDAERVVVGVAGDVAVTGGVEVCDSELD